MSSHEKSLISLRYWLQGSGMHLALKSLEFALRFHTGTRKDGVTPEINHQLWIIGYLRTMVNHLEFPEETLAAGALHDVCEDYNVGFEEIRHHFGDAVSQSVMLLSKKHRGSKLPTDVYYDRISDDVMASVVKGADRICNIQTMIGVFTLEKQTQYIKETEDLVLPMLKKARRKFTRQEPAYENEKLMLHNQLSLIKEIHSGMIK